MKSAKYSKLFEPFDKGSLDEYRKLLLVQYQIAALK